MGISRNTESNMKKELFEAIGGSVQGLYWTKFLESILIDKQIEEGKAKKSHVNKLKKDVKGAKDDQASGK